MKTEFLTALGLEKDIADKILAENGRDIEALKAENETAKQQIVDFTNSLKDRDKQLDELKKVDAAGLQSKIAELQESNKTAAAEHKAQMAQLQKTAALKLALAEKVHDPDDIITKLDLEKIEMEDGRLKSQVDDLLAPIKESKPYLFKNAGVMKGAKPGDAGDPNKDTPSAIETQIQGIFGLK
jgi:Phage minor structural protein GP20.